MDLPPTETAGDAHADVLLREPQFLLTVGAFGIHIRLCDRRVCRVESKVRLAELALHPLSHILPIDLQFLSAVWAAHEYAGRCDFNHDINLLQRDENGNLNTFPFEFRIQQCPAFPTMNNIRRHVFTAIWAKTPRPSRHISSSIAGSKSTVTRKVANGNLLHVPNHPADFECLPSLLRHGFNHSGFFVATQRPLIHSVILLFPTQFAHTKTRSSHRLVGVIWIFADSFGVPLRSRDGLHGAHYNNT